MAREKIMGLMGKAGLGIGALLFLLVPLLASAVEYTPLSTINRGLTYPTDMAVSSGDGTVFVVDGLAKRVLKYDGAYRYTGSISSVEIPVAIAVSSAGTLYIADNKTKSVKIVDPATGQVTGSLMKAGAMATFELPRNIAVGPAPDNHVYVVDQFADSIEVFDAAGQHLQTITGLTMPQDVVASAGELYIIDQPQVPDGAGSTSMLNGSRIQVYDLNSAQFITDHAFPTFGNNTDLGQYISLKGISIDPQGNIYVSDSFLQVVYMYSREVVIDNGDGTTTVDTALGSFMGPINDGFATPLGMTVSEDGRLLVTSSFDGLVKVLGVDSIAGADTWMNETPVAVAGASQTIDEGSSFVLDGSGSSDADSGGIKEYIWTQTDGTLVLAENPFVTSSPQVSLTAPAVDVGGALLGFELVVVDLQNKSSLSSGTEVSVVNVMSLPDESVVINGNALGTTIQAVTLTLNAPEASEMRIANENTDINGALFEAYTTSKGWTLSDGDGQKTVSVQFRDAGGSVAMASGTIMLDMTAPAVPVADLNAANGQFDWSAAGEPGVTYVLQYAFNSDFTVDVRTISGITFNGADISLEGLAVGTWYWRVQAVDSLGNTSAWSDVGTFAIAPDCSVAPDAPQLALPFNNADNILRTAILETNGMIYPDGCGTHLRTEWQVSEDIGFNALVMHVGTTLDNLTVYQIPALVLEPATTYYWRVRQVASNGAQSDWSEIWAFTTIAAPDEPGVDGVLYVQPEGGTDGSGEEISIKDAIGDAGVRIKAIRVSAGVVTQTIKDLDPATIPDTVNKPASFPLGLLSFKLIVEPGAYVQVEVSFSGAVPNDAEWYIYNVAEGWHPYAGAIFSRNRRSVTLNFQDGGIGDADGVVNGIIVNP